MICDALMGFALIACPEVTCSEPGMQEKIDHAITSGRQGEFRRF